MKMFFKLYEKIKKSGNFHEKQMLEYTMYDILDVSENQDKYLMTTNGNNIDAVSRIIETVSSSAIERIGLEISMQDSLKIFQAGKKTDNEELNANDELNKFIRNNHKNIDINYENIINFHNILFRETKHYYQAGKIAIMGNKIEVKTSSGRIVSEIKKANGI